MTSKHSSASRHVNTGLFDGLNLFGDLEARISALPGNKERGDAFEIFAEAYLATQKIAQAQQVWPFEAIPLAQRQALSLDTGRDMGVDGTYLTVDGELRAYQVKFRSNRPSLTWDELSTFMGLTDQVSQRVLFTNCESLPSLMQDRSGFVPIRGSDLDRLTAEDFEAIRQWLQTGQVKLPHKHPLPHQQEALTAIAHGLQENDHATVIMACGTGKSLVALWAAEQYGGKTILVLVPSLALVRQLLHEWLRETAWERFTFMCVCSDPTVAKGADDLIVHQADLDFPVTTESAVVSRFLNKAFDGVKIVFSTYQSAQVVAAGMPVGADGVVQPFDLAIFDEAHKTASRTGTRFSFALEDANLPIRKRLFFTATPRHYDVRKKDKEGDAELVYSMDRPAVYGPVIHTLSFAEAARRGIICDYKVVISVVTSEMVNDDLLKHGEVIVDGDVVKAHQVAVQIALQRAVEKYGVSRIFTFHSSVIAARSFTSNDGDGIKQHLTDFTTLHVSGEMATSRREQQMRAFREASKAVISNARCLTEGVDVPAVDMVAFISPRKSKVDIVQATGRAMRKYPGKQFGYVMVPLFVEQVADESIEAALHRTGFDDVWDLLGAMKDQDDVLADIIRQMRVEKGRVGGYDATRLDEHIDILGPSLSLESIRRSVSTECVEHLAENWDERFGELLAFVKENGHPHVPRTHTNSRLASWVWIQRQRRRGTSNALPLTPKQFEMLDQIGFRWDGVAERSDDVFEDKFDQLVTFAKEHGHCEVPTNYRENTELASYVGDLRRRCKDGTLSPERIGRLDAIGFMWTTGGLNQAWLAMYQRLNKYKDSHGDVDVPHQWKEDPSLAAWVSAQRQSRKAGNLSNERMSSLDQIQFTWKSRERGTWDDRFEELAAFKELHGHLNVPAVCPEMPKIRQFINTARFQKAHGKLPADRETRLKSLGFSWSDPIQEIAVVSGSLEPEQFQGYAHDRYSIVEDGATATGKVFVLTGKFPKLGRGRASALIEARGGSVGDHVTKKTDFLVAGPDAGSKLDKARLLGVVIINEDDLLLLLGQES